MVIWNQECTMYEDEDERKPIHITPTDGFVFLSEMSITIFIFNFF